MNAIQRRASRARVRGVWQIRIINNCQQCGRKKSRFTADPTILGAGIDEAVEKAIAAQKEAIAEFHPGHDFELTVEVKK